MIARIAIVLVGLCACRSAHTNLVSDLDAGHGTVRRDAATAIDAASSIDASAHTPSARCGKQACACDDGLDNDQDGLIDGLDPECTGSFDNDESTFATGEPSKQNACRDCFWDDNAGNGNDGCRYPAECLTGAATKNKGNCSSCEVTQACHDYCQVRTPNGCDCFGCCEVVAPQGEHVFIELSDSCALDRLQDMQACPRCVQDSACANPCDRCELCLGKRASELPADCGAKSGGGPAYSCGDGQPVCSLSVDCPGTMYCQLGCCLVDLL